MDDSRELSWLGRGAPPAPVYPEAVAWRVEKDSRWAEARIRVVPHGRELRIVVGGAGRQDELMQSCVYAPMTESAELAQMSEGTRVNFLGHGWRMVNSAEPAV